MRVSAPSTLLASNPLPMADAVVGWMLESLVGKVRFWREVAGCVK